MPSIVSLRSDLEGSNQPDPNAMLPSITVAKPKTVNRAEYRHGRLIANEWADGPLTRSSRPVEAATRR
jgi:hypothetical protein